MQLYTVRADMAKDFEGTLARVAGLGFREVEFAGYFERTPQAVRAVLDRNGLTSPATHVDLASLTTRLPQVIEASQAIGHTFIVMPWLDDAARKEPDIWKRVAETLNRAGEATRRAGIKMAYHNHHFEFVPVSAGGKMPLDLLLESCDPQLVAFELDLAWITAAGQDPLAYFQKYPGRFPMVHVKGLRKRPAQGASTPIDQIMPDIVDVGGDSIDWARIFARSGEAGIQHYFVEHDQPASAFDSLRTSYQVLAALEVLSAVTHPPPDKRRASFRLARYGSVAAAVVAAGALATRLWAPSVPISSAEWTAYGGDRGNTKYSPVSEIDASNAKGLGVAWRWASPDNEIAKTQPGLHVNLFEGTPVVFDGSLYVATGLHQVASIDAQTGKTRWVYDPGIYTRGTPQRLGFVHRGVALWREGGRVFLATGEGYLTALDITTGKPVEGFGQGGSVDLLDGLRRPVARFQFGVNSPPIVVGDVVVVGSFVQDGWRTMKGPPGDVRGYDVRTGRRLWTFHTIPESDEVGADTWLNQSGTYTGSANVWAVMSADEELGYVYLPTSTPTNDHYGGHRPGDNLFAESVVALDARTGKRVWHFQAVHHGVWDYDLPAPPVLADVTIDGRRRKILAQVSKQAFVYVLDRETGAPIWPIDERPVPRSTVPGESLSATQPFPTRPVPFDRQGLAVDDLIDFTPALRREAVAILNAYDFGSLFTPPSERGTVVMPGAVGGASWAGAGFDPESGWLYVPSVTNPYVMRLSKLDQASSDMRYAAFGSDRFGLSGPDGLPMTKPPYGRITAIDLNSGDHKWVATHGSGPRDHVRLKALNLPPLGWPSRGFVLVTKTLLFAAQEPAISASFSQATNAFQFTATSREPKVSVFDKRTGQLLSETALPANAGGSPMTYSVASRQFIVVPIGGGGVPAELVALTLGGQ